MLAFPLFPVLVIGLLIVVNGFLSASEFALVSVRRTWLQQRAAQSDKRAEAALKLVDNLNGVVSGTQLGITMTSMGLGWVAEVTIARWIDPFVPAAGKGHFALVHSGALALAFLSITFVHFMLGELVPKQVALGRAEQLTLMIAWPMTFYLKIVGRPLAILYALSFSVARHLGAKAEMDSSEVSNIEELKLIVSSEESSLPEHQQDMIHRVIDLSSVMARQVMVPRTNIVSVSVDLSLSELLRIVTEDQHSRIPIYEGSPEHLIGVLYTKDLLKVWEEQQAGASDQPLPFSLRSLVRELLVVPETKPIDQLLQEFQRRRRHMALVVDEFGSTVGLITVEDVLEQIVGEIEDEYDWETPPGLRLGERTLVLDARVSLLDLENQYDLLLPQDKGFETLAGFMLQQLGHIPRPGESFVHNDRRFTVLAVEGHRVARVRVEKLERPAASQ